MLLGLFDANELRRFVTNLPDGNSLLSELPQAEAPLATQVDVLIGVLERRARIDEDLWNGLVEARPGCRDAVEEARRSWTHSPPPAPRSGRGRRWRRTALAAAGLAALVALLASVGRYHPDPVPSAQFLRVMDEAGGPVVGASVICDQLPVGPTDGAGRVKLPPTRRIPPVIQYCIVSGVSVDWVEHSINWVAGGTIEAADGTVVVPSRWTRAAKDLVEARERLRAPIAPDSECSPQTQKELLDRVALLRRVVAGWQTAHAEVLSQRGRLYGPDTEESFTAWMDEVGLSHLDLRGIRLGSACSCLADLDGVVLTGADLTRADLSGVDLEHGQFDGIVAPNSIWDRAWLEDAVFDGATVTNASFREAHLYGATVDRAKLDQCDLSQADLRHVDLGLASRDEIILEGACLWGATPDDRKCTCEEYQDNPKLTCEQIRAARTHHDPCLPG